MSAYRHVDSVAVAPRATVSRGRTPLILGISALLHGALLGTSAWMQPKSPPPPREVTVMKWQAVELENGELGWRNDGLRQARVRGDGRP